MRKPLNRIALAVGIGGVIYFVGRVSVVLVAYAPFAQMAATATTPIEHHLLSALSEGLSATRMLETVLAGLLGASQLIALATIIELIDRILWRTRNPEGGTAN